MSNNEIVRTENQFVAVIERLATDPNSDLSKLEKMMDMQERVLDKQAEQAFAASMAAMQSEMPRVFELAQGHNLTYARLEDINDTIRPVLEKHGFCVTFATNQDDLKAVKVTAICSHKLGAKQETSLILPLDTSGSKNAVQAVGSTVSYGKRYTMCALLNISTGNDNNGFELGKSAGEISGKEVLSAEDVAKLACYLYKKSDIEFYGYVSSLDNEKRDNLYNSGIDKEKTAFKADWNDKEKSGIIRINEIKSMFESDDDEISEDALTGLNKLEIQIVNK
tara:strand:+ start:186 stop:1022 length:837 start_codon:yes stop_codon:yes gene_type:complete